eukprot:gene11992-12136_t
MPALHRILGIDYNVGNVLLLQPVALAVLQPVWNLHDPKISPERMQSAVEKFCESLWKLLVYSMFFLVGVAANWQQPWMLDTQQLFAGWPGQPFSTPQRLLYHLELAFYISSIFMIVLWEVRRKDFTAMFSHHIATVILIATSWHFRFWRVGTLVMLLHDATDILMEAAKLLKYSRKEDLSVGMFAMFVIAWLLLRLMAYPLMVIRSTLFELPVVLGGRPPMYYMFNSLLLLLFVLHCYWFTLIMKVVWLALTTGAANDVREDDD